MSAQPDNRLVESTGKYAYHVYDANRPGQGESPRGYVGLCGATMHWERRTLPFEPASGMCLRCAGKLPG